MKLGKKIVALSLLVCTLSYAETYYDHHGNGTQNFKVYTNQFEDGKIKNIYDEGMESRVIELKGSGLHTGFQLGSDGSLGDTASWNNTTERELSWSMKYSEDYIIYVSVQTTKGHRFLTYDNSDTNRGEDRGGIHHGLGSSSNNGTWKSFTRDLQADLEDFDSGNAIISVDGFFIRGSGDVDNIKLGDTVYEDAEDGLNTRWKVYTNLPENGKITKVYDEEKDSNVTQLKGNGLYTGFRLGANGSGGDVDAWNNTTERELSWSMKYSEDYIIYVSVQTTKGHRFLTYDNSDTNRGEDRGGIHHGLGSSSNNGTWKSFTRDLQADLEDFDSGNTIISVDGFFIRGSGRIDDIKLDSNNSASNLNKPITREELIAKIANGEDVTHVNTSKITDMSHLFAGNKDFNQDISGWDVSNVTDMSGMFDGAESFNQDIGGWDVSNVNYMMEMFQNAYAFNQDIGNWDVSSVGDMSAMFQGAHAFNQDLSRWDVSNVFDMTIMFQDAGSFKNQDLSSWNVENVDYRERMLYLTGGNNIAPNFKTAEDYCEWLLEDGEPNPTYSENPTYYECINEENRRLARQNPYGYY